MAQALIELQPHTNVWFHGWQVRLFKITTPNPPSSASWHPSCLLVRNWAQIPSHKGKKKKPKKGGSTAGGSGAFRCNSHCSFPLQGAPASWNDPLKCPVLPGSGMAAPWPWSRTAGRFPQVYLDPRIQQHSQALVETTAEMTSVQMRDR